MNKNKLIELCLKHKDAVNTQPFKRDEYREIHVIRHRTNNKWFALIFDADDKLYINLKCKPEISMALREQYDYIIPAWHMNKKHWNTINVNKADIDVLKKLIEISFELTGQKHI